MAEKKTCAVLMATYGDWLSVAHILPRLDRELETLGLRGRVVVIDDASTNTAGRETIESLPLKAIECVDEVCLGSNQGNQRAVAVGVAYVAKNVPCDYLVVMDSDNEDKPEDVPRLLEACMAHDDRKIVFAGRAKRSEGRLFRVGYWCYKRLFTWMTGRSIAMGNFCVIPGHQVKRVSHIAQLWNHFPISIQRSGIPWTMVATERGTRLFGTGSMNTVRLVIHAFSGFSIYADIMAVRLLMFSLLLTGAFFVLALLVAAAWWFKTDIFLPGWTSQILLQAFLLFAQLVCTSLVVLILVLSLRLQPPMIPFYDHERFIYEVNRLFAR